ncbi:MAG: efflux RND transporter periplasmic adaptor subunit [Steroidobacter sp.]
MTKKLTLIGAALVVLLASLWLGSKWMQAPSGAPTDVAAVDGELPYRAGPFRLDVAVAPEAPVVGANTLTVRLQDTQGNPVSDAAIRAVAEMPAMGAMSAMRAPSEMQETSPGVYVGTFEPSMAGAWPLTLAITKEGAGEATVSFDLATGRKGLTLSSGGTRVSGAEQADGQRSDAGGQEYTAEPYRFAVELKPTAPIVGENTLIVHLKDKNGEPLSDASIRAVAEMPAMGTMPAMRAPAEMRETSPGVYVGTFEPAMEGAWPLSLTLQASDLPARTVTFDMATGRQGLHPSAGIDASGDMGERAPAGTINVDATRRQMIGLTTGTAEPRALTRTIRAVGRVVYDETQLADVNLKYEAWVGDVMADYVGKQVEKGEVLFTVYSPDLYAAQQEYLETSRRTGGGGDLLEAARQRLRFWDVSDTFIREITRRGEPQKYVPIRSPRSGVVVEKNVVEGTSHQGGMRLMRIADLSQVWIEADVYEADLSLVEAGMPATVTLPYLPGAVLKGAVEYMYPYLQGKTRTAQVRIAFPNPGGMLKPDMYAEAKLIAPLGERLAVPEEAVLIAGEHRFVFEDLGGGQLAPRRVHTGYRADGFVEIREGLEPGDRVVTSGNFLIASESRLKAGLDQW